MATFRKRGGKFQARVQRKGFPAQSKSFGNRSDAERWARGVERQIDLGEYAPRDAVSDLSLGDLLARYASEVSPTKRGGMMEAIRLKAMGRRDLAREPAARLTARVVASYRDDRLEEVAGVTVNRDLDDLSAVLNHARREWGLPVPNPVSDVRRPARGPHRSRVLEADEEAKLIAALDTPVRDQSGRFNDATRNPWVKPIVEIAIETAMRRGELLALEWSNVDLVKRTGTLPLTKNGDARTVPFSSKAVTVLKQLPRVAGEALVFPISGMALRKAFERACQRAGIVDLHFHDLRHTATTRLSRRLPNVIELAAVTGHRDLKMLQRYYHPTAQDLAIKLG